MINLVKLKLLVTSLIFMGYGYYQIYMDIFVRPNIILGFTGVSPYTNPMISVMIALLGTSILFGLYCNRNYEKELTAWKEERCPHCGEKIH